MHCRTPASRRSVAAGQVMTRWHWGCVAALFVSLSLPPVFAAVVTVQVLDSSGKPVPAIVVTLVDQRAAAASGDARNLSISMDQVNMRFVPDVLVVPAGASVAFPNSDTVSHQVYSFSPAKTFQLSLYKGSTNPPVVFDRPGLVVLGCNIHDMMVAYIYVTSAPWYGQTDAHGQITWNAVNSGAITVTIWSPLLAEATETLSQTVQLDAISDRQTVTFKLRKPIRSSPQPRPRRADWDY